MSTRSLAPGAAKGAKLCTVVAGPQARDACKIAVVVHVFRVCPEAGISGKPAKHIAPAAVLEALVAVGPITECGEPPVAAGVKSAMPEIMEEDEMSRVLDCGRRPGGQLARRGQSPRS